MDIPHRIAIPRLEPNGAVIMIGTRFSEGDIFGRVLDGPDADQWTVVRLPAICDSEDDLLHRQIGEALWAQRISADELRERKREMGTRAYECQFQQNPVPLEGNLIKAEWFQRYDQPPESFRKVVVGIDAAAKTGIHNDESCIVKLGVTGNAFFLLDCWTARVEFPDLLKRVVALEDETPKCSAIYVEDASNATAMLQVLKQSTRLPVIGVTAKGSKLSRVEACTGVFEAKKVFFPNEAPWLLTLERQLLGFPGTKRDDAVDALCLALSQVLNKKLTSWWFTFGGNGPDEHYFGPDDHSADSEEALPYMGSVSTALSKIGL